MLAIMKRTDALGELDINDEDFLGGHGRERSHVAVMQEAYKLGADQAVWDCLRSVGRDTRAADEIRAVARRMGVVLR
jgi:hypothetical protein